MSWRNDDTEEGLPFGLPQDPKASPDGAPQKGDADDSFTPGEKAIIDILKQQREEIRELREQVLELTRKVEAQEIQLRKHDEYVRGEHSSDEEKIAVTTQTFLVWIDVNHKKEWESGVVKCVKTIRDGKIIFVGRQVSSFLKLLFRCMANSVRSKYKKTSFKELNARISKYCMQEKGTEVVPIGDIHTLISRACSSGF